MYEIGKQRKRLWDGEAEWNAGNKKRSDTCLHIPVSHRDGTISRLFSCDFRALKDHRYNPADILQNRRKALKSQSHPATRVLELGSCQESLRDSTVFPMWVAQSFSLSVFSLLSDRCISLTPRRIA